MDATELIEKVEGETGVRFDSNGFDNSAMTMLFGAIANAMANPDKDILEDAFAVGTIVKSKRDSSREVLGRLLEVGMTPDSIVAIGELLS